MTIERKLSGAWPRLLVGIAAIVAWLSISAFIDYATPTEGAASVDDENSLRYRSLALSEYLDPKSTSPRGLLALPLVHFYIKTSGNHPYLDRSIVIADTFGQDADGMTFLTDNNNLDEVDEFARMRPWASIRHVEGTDLQGAYKGAHQNKGEAFHAQRLKTRAVFNDFLGGTLEPKKPDWVCYLDDDMLVNVTNLKSDLVSKESQCLPDCLIASSFFNVGANYTAGGWCMNQSFASKVGELLSEKSDEELGWKGTDDVDFNRDVLQKWFGVSPTDSELWFSELSWRGSSAKYRSTESLHKGSLSAFKEKVTPSLAVYHLKYNGA